MFSGVNISLLINQKSSENPKTN